MSVIESDEAYDWSVIHELRRIVVQLKTGESGLR